MADTVNDIEDATNIIGLSTLVNKKHTDEKLDLDKLEKSMIGSQGIRIVKEHDPAQEFSNTLRELSKDTGLDLTSAKPVAAVAADQSNSADSESESGSGSGSGSESGSESGSSSRSVPIVPQAEPHQSPHHEHHHSPHREPHREHHHSPSRHENVPARPQSREQFLDDALRAYSGAHGDFSIAKEQEEDMKSTLLADIEELLDELSHEDTDLSRVPSVNQESTLDKIKKVHKILRMKYDRRRCNTLGKECILAGVQALEYFLDGKHKLGPFGAPDLTGFHNNVRNKLSKLRYETSTLTASVLQEYNIGPTGRLILELLPSAIIYSHMRQERHGQSNYSPSEMSSAHDELRQFERPTIEKT